MIAVDTNILVYAHRKDLPLHLPARRSIETLAGGTGRWAIPWPCVHEFLAVVTNRRVFNEPSPSEAAVATLRAIAHSGRCDFLSEGEGHLELLEGLLTAARVGGGQVHDARIAAICLAHGVRELWSADRDFSRYPRLKIVNPLVTPGVR